MFIMTKLKNNLAFLLLGLILLIHTLLITKLIYFPYPELFIYPYLTNHGLLPYSQILDQHFPGLMFLPLNLNNLGMTTPEIARAWSIIIVMIIQIMLFFISSEILKSKTKALFVNMLFLIWHPFFEGWVLWIDNFLPLLLLPAFYFLYRGKQGDQGKRDNKWFFISGLLLGLSVVFKQTMIPLSLFTLIYIFLTTRNLRTVMTFLLGGFIPVSLMLIHLFSIGVFWHFWYWTVIFNLTTYAQSGTKAPPSTGYVSRVVFVFGGSLLALLNWKKGVVPLLFIFIAGSLIGAFERADFVHLQPSLPFVVLATVYGLGRLGRLGKWGFMGVYGLVAVWWVIIFYKGHLGNRVIAFDPNTWELAVKIRNYTSPRERIFVFGAEPHLYQMSDTLPAGDVFIFQFPWFFKVAEGRILEGIIQDKPNIIVSDRTVIIEGQKMIEFGKDIDQYINQNYQKIDSVGTTDILRRKS